MKIERAHGRLSRPQLRRRRRLRYEHLVEFDETDAEQRNSKRDQAAADRDRAAVDREEAAADRVAATSGLTASTGIAMLDDEFTTADDVLVAADLTMYDAKEAGKNRSLAYSTEEHHEPCIEARMTHR